MTVCEMTAGHTIAVVVIGCGLFFIVAAQIVPGEATAGEATTGT